MIYIFIPIFILVVILSVFVSNKVVKLNLSSVRYTEIDGVRGYLAVFVFFYHSYIWHVFLNTNKWEEPRSNLFNHFGQTSVVLFFIITAFLFTTKKIEINDSDFDWIRYKKSRFFRMFPMYFISILAILVIILFESNFEAKKSVFTILKSTLSWLFFIINGSNATVLPKIKIVQNVIAPAGAVVTKDVPDNFMVTGIPAIYKKELSPLTF